MQFLLGITIASLISGAAWRFRALTPGGALAAAIGGGLIFGVGGLQWALPMVVFFLSSSVLSQAFKARKRGIHDKFSKGNRRDVGQVLANGGLGSFLVLFLFLDFERIWLWTAYLGAMAAVNADTWATELGVLNPKPPRSIVTGKMVDPGTSGGISLLGMMASFGGALLIGLVGAVYTLGANSLAPLLAATFGGICGCIFDSWLGATVQAIFHCPNCHKETEHHPRHSCGTKTFKIRGWDWLNNDMVNFLASAVGAGIAIGVWSLFR